VAIGDGLFSTGAATPPAGRLIALADRIGNRYCDEHGGRGSDADDQREWRGGDREERERRQSQQPRTRDVPERPAEEEDLGEQEQRRCESCPIAKT
jgi:hypothetical protein